ncbi:hypothetical protein [Leptospira sp. Pond_2020]|nr:hypothetical protein [Leptospira sp. Pond_2020]MCD1182303.1 hypothetical protein [Leptospira sp. Pond_2020]
MSSSTLASENIPPNSDRSPTTAACAKEGSESAKRKKLTPLTPYLAKT